MIIINNAPCHDCSFFMGIKQPDGTEKTEYIHCEIAKDNNAKNLFKNHDGNLICTKKERKDE